MFGKMSFDVFPPLVFFSLSLIVRIQTILFSRSISILVPCVGLIRTISSAKLSVSVVNNAVKITVT